MRSTVRRTVALAVIVALLAGGGLVAYGISVRPDLDRARDAAQQRWLAVRNALDTRYELLGTANDAARTAGGSDRDVVRDLDTALAQWSDAFESGDGTVADEVRAANTLEGLGRRLVAVVDGSPVLRADAAVTAALAAFRGAPVPPSGTAFDDAVHAYEQEREGRLRRFVAGLLGYDPLPLLDRGGPAAA